MVNAPFLEDGLAPSADSCSLPRRDLIAKFQANPDERLVVICAESGYGKTTTLTQLSQISPHPSYFYRLRQGDSQRAFLIALTTELERLYPQLTALPKRSFDVEHLFDPDCQRAFSGLAELATTLPQPLALFLDDYHLAAEDRGLAAVIELLLDRLPSGSRLVLASRVRPPHLPLGRLRVQRRLVEIGGRELRFSREETAAFWRGADHGLSEEEINKVYRITEGWPAALKLIEGVVDLAAELVSATGLAAVDDFLQRQIWTGFDEELKRFLLAGSALESLDARLCQAALGLGGTNTLIRLGEIAAAGSALICCRKANRYRLHPLLKRFLLNELRRQYSSRQIKRLHGRFAGEWEGRGDYAQAIHHCFEAGAQDEACLLIDRYGAELAGKQEARLLERWLPDITAGQERERPWITFFKAELRCRSGQPDRAAFLYRRAGQAFTSLGDLHGACHCLLAESRLLHLLGKQQPSWLAASAAMQLAPSPGQYLQARCVRILPALLSGKGPAEKWKVDQITETEVNHATLQARAELLLDWLRICCIKGDFLVALKFITEAAPERSQWVASLSQGDEFQRYKTLLLGLTGSYDEAFSSLATAMDRAGKTGSNFELLLLRELRPLLLQAFDRVDEARQELSRTASAWRSAGLPLAGIYAQWGSLLRRTGNPDEAFQLHRKALAEGRQARDRGVIAQSLVDIGAVKCEAGYDGGTVEVQAAAALATKFGYKYVLSQAHYHLARRALRAGNRVGALREMKHCLELAFRHGHSHFLLQEAKHDPTLLVFALEQEVQTQRLIDIFVQVGQVALPCLLRLLDSQRGAVRALAIRATVAAGGATMAPIIRSYLRDDDEVVRHTVREQLERLRSGVALPEKVLSRREYQILPLLAAGSSNAEIADQLYISEATVKTHLTRIFRKLGLTRRSQAAAFLLPGGETIGSLHQKID